MDYMALKHFHLTTIAVTFLLFSLRGLWMLLDSPRLQRKWVRIVPHINDTLLLASGIGLASMLSQYPFQDHWLTAKVMGLIAYIVLGTVALKRGKTKTVRVIALVAAYAAFFYIVRVALTKNPLPW